MRLPKECYKCPLDGDKCGMTDRKCIFTHVCPCFKCGEENKSKTCHLDKDEW